MNEPAENKSWSEKLFLQVNSLVGVSPLRDRFMYFFAHWLIYLHIAAVFALGAVFFLEREGLFLGWLVQTGFALFLSLFFSYGIALLWHHDRPTVELPKIKSLLRPLFTWKSFPSDHTIAVTVTTVSFALFSPPLWTLAVLGFTMLLVPVGRVYVGVHYPRDIVGGLTIGILCTLAAYAILLL